MSSSAPELQAAIGPRVRVSPFFDATRRAGLVAVSTYNHMWLPMGFGDPECEYERLTTGVSMWDVAAQRHVAVSGPDADRLVQLATAVDVSSVGRSRAVYAPVVDRDGILINDPVLFHWPDGTWRFSAADSDLRLWLSGVATGADLSAQVEELDTATLAVQGPDAMVVMEALDLGWADDLESLELRPGSVAGIEVVVSRSGWSTQGGVELFLDDVDRAEDLWDAVAGAGEPFGIGPGGPNPQERLESVLLSYGTDTGYHADPLELGLEDHLDLDGPPFIGQDALRRIREQGPKRRLRGAVIGGEHLDTLWRPVPYRAGGEVVGQLRSANWSPRFDRNLGLALLDAAQGPGDRGEVTLEDGPRPVELVAIPFDEGSLPRI